MGEYDAISEIFPENGDPGPPTAPLAEWDIEVLERGLSVELGDVGGREPFVANARVQVTEEDGSSWSGLTRIESVS